MHQLSLLVPPQRSGVLAQAQGVEAKVTSQPATSHTKINNEGRAHTGAGITHENMPSISDDFISCNDARNPLYCCRHPPTVVRFAEVLQDIPPVPSKHDFHSLALKMSWGGAAGQPRSSASLHLDARPARSAGAADAAGAQDLHDAIR